MPKRIRPITLCLAIGAFALSWIGALAPITQAADRPPNIVVFFTDDQGYNDVGVYGSPLIKTPRIDRMAKEGMRFTDFYAQIVCGPSRAALLTGCYPIRLAEPGNTKSAHTVLHAKEKTIAEVLKASGYATAAIGKWHVAGTGANKPELMPNGQGFDYFYGTPSHNGTTREIPPNSKRPQIVRNDKVLESPGDMNLLTQNYTNETVEFIRRNRDKPFFVYLAHTMPHVPLGASPAFRGRSPRGLYGDVIEELDWSLGRVIDTLEELNLDENTLVILTSDNGPWIEDHLGDHGGSAAPLRGFKMNTWEGGCRVPGIAWWPGTVKAGVVTDEIMATLDFMPTFAKLAGATLPKGLKIDGVDMSGFLKGEVAESPRQEFLYYGYTHLQAVRMGKWKLVLPRPANPAWTSWYGRMMDAVKTTALYDMSVDPEEFYDVAKSHPEVVARLMKRVKSARSVLGDYNRIGTGARFFDKGPKRPDMDNWKKKKR